MSTHDTLGFGESTVLLHTIFPRYHDLFGMKPAPEVSIFLPGLRSQSSHGRASEKPLPAVDDN